MKNTYSATQAARNFSDILNRIRYRGEEFVIERGGEPVCRIVPAAPFSATGGELKAFFSKIPKPDKEFWDVVADVVKNQPLMPQSPWRR